MPNIQQYDVPEAQSQIRPSDTGASSLERAGAVTQRVGRVQQETAREEGMSVAQSWQKVGQFVGAAGHLVDDYVTQKDIASAAEQHTRLAAQAAKDLPSILANAADPVKAVNDYYDQTMKPALEQINSGMMTKRSRMWAAEHSQQGASQFLHSGIAEATNLAGARALTSFHQSVDNLSDQARANPHDFEGIISQSDHLIDGVKSTLSPSQQIALEDHRNVVHQKIAVAAGHALAEEHPDQFTKDLVKGWGKGHITEEQRTNLMHYAQYVSRDKLLKAQATSASTLVDWSQGGSSGQGQPWTPQGVGWVQNNPFIHGEDKTDGVRMGVLATKVRMWSEAHTARKHPAPTGDMNDEYLIRDAIKNGKGGVKLIGDGLQRFIDTNGQFGINHTKAESLMKLLHPEKVEKYAAIHNDPVLKSSREQAEEQIIGIATRGTDQHGGGADASNPALKAKIRQFRMDTDKTLEAAHDRGENVQEYWDPASPKYLFSRERMERYVPSKREIKDQVVISPEAPFKSVFIHAQPKPDVKPESSKGTRDKYFPWMKDKGGK